MKTRLRQSRVILSALPADARPAVTALAAVSAACVWLGLIRWWVSGQTALLWMCGNLFLAWVPLVCALAIRHELAGGTTPRAGRLALAAGWWFFFFPNAPYLVTDLIHLHPRQPVPLWFDTLLLAGFAGTGLLLGYVSLFLLEKPIRQRWGTGAGRAFAVGMLLVGSFGVYLGRFQRWNSWDVLVRPHRLLWDSLRVANPFSAHHHGPAGFCLVFALLLVAGYGVLRGGDADGRAVRTTGAVDRPQVGRDAHSIPLALSSRAERGTSAAEGPSTVASESSRGRSLGCVTLRSG